MSERAEDPGSPGEEEPGEAEPADASPDTPAPGADPRGAAADAAPVELITGPSQARARLRGRILGLIKILLAIGLMAFIFLSGMIDFDHLARLSARLELLVLAFVAMAMPTLINTVRWRLLLRAAGFEVSLWRVFQLNHVGNFFNNFSLGAVGGDLIKVYYVVKSSPQARARAGLTVFVDRYIGLMALIAIACFASYPMWSRFDQPAVQVLVGGVFALLFAMVAAAWLASSVWLRTIPPVTRLLARLPAAFRSLDKASTMYREHPGKVAAAFGLSFLTHGCMLFGVVCLAWALEVPARVVDYLYLIPIGLFLNALPISFGSWGTGEIAWAELFEFAAVDLGPTNGAELCFLLHILMLFWSLSGGLLYLTYRDGILESTAKPSEP